jgi:hypothetical protein
MLVENALFILFYSNYFLAFRAGCTVRRSATFAEPSNVSTMGHWLNRLLLGGKIPFRAVAQTVGFGIGKVKIRYLSIGFD